MPPHLRLVLEHQRRQVLRDITIRDVRGYFDEAGNAGRWKWGNKVCHSRACLGGMKEEVPCVVRWVGKDKDRESLTCERCAEKKYPCGAAGKGE